MIDQTISLQAAGIRFESLSVEHRDVITSPVLSDSLDASGRRHQVMTREMCPVSAGLRTVGRARTVQFTPSDEDADDPYGDAMAFIDSLIAGDVAVIGTGGDPRTAYWGELFTAAAMGRGAAGTVCDGPVRDTPKVRDLGYPLFCAGTRPIDFRARMRVTAMGEPVECGGVRIIPGDLVFGDDDGVVVVPAEVEDQVLRRAVSRVSAESSVLSELLAGASLREVWDRWRVL